MTNDEIDKTILDQKILEGKWPKETHEKQHQRMFNNLVELLADIENSNLATEGLPVTKEGSIDWDKMSISFLIQWSLMNGTKITHTHEVKNVQSSSVQDANIPKTTL